MKLLLDLQALQTGSASRGIGRYSSAFACSLIDRLAGWDVYVLINDSEFESERSQHFSNIIGKLEKDRVIYYPLAKLPNVAMCLHEAQANLSKVLRERIIEALCPDVVLVTSLFEFEALSTIPAVECRSYFCAAILYDLIPLSYPQQYLGDDELRNWYADRLRQLKNADAILAISDYVKCDAVSKIGLPEDRVANISAGTDLHKFKDVGKDGKPLGQWRGFSPYVLYVGGFDSRKNVERLISCFAEVSDNIGYGCKLVLAGGLSESRDAGLREFIKSCGLQENQVFITGYVDERELAEIYRNAHLFVFPSIDEGFGLPPLEAMGFGVPVIASNRASMPEVIDNPEALFDPENREQFCLKLRLGIGDEKFRAELKVKGLQRAAYFSWERSAEIAVKFMHEKRSTVKLGRAEKYGSFREFVEKSSAGKICLNDAGERVKIVNLLARGLHSVSKSGIDPQMVSAKAPELSVNESFSGSIPDYSYLDKPYVFSSTLCREQHFHLPLYAYWCKALREKPRLHRKQWEFVYICQTLFERGFLRDGLSALGFGVGKEPLVSLFAHRGVRVMATDLDFANAERLGWVTTGQHSHDLSYLNEYGLCDPGEFERLVTFRSLDMNDIPQDIGCYDICWSSCAFEHLGSIRRGLDFVRHSARLLNPGGIAVHTTEYNVGSNSDTLDNNTAFVIFRRCDIELLIDELSDDGYEVEAVDFSAGEDELERYVDLPPYVDEPHLRLQLAGQYTSTSLGIIVRAPGEKIL